ncbi:MAG: glycerophosphodiester phosphodiesterase [Halomonadaceae bacterium]|nr:MAG: glycerophosphodiester phosphodiesterase [Halomonadaceae bacterium]
MQIYGHRGAKGEAPENSLDSFIHAYGHGVRHFEMDVQLSKDGEPVIIHDLTLERTTGRKGLVADNTMAQLATMDARYNTSPWPTATGIPSLFDVVEACPDFAHLQLEVKSDTRQRMNVLCNRLVEWIQRKQWHQRITLTSSDQWFLRAVKRRNRSISTGFVAERRFPRPVATARELGCNYLCPSKRLCTEALVTAAHKAGMHVSSWTVNRIHDMTLLEQMGIDSVITDYPTSALIYFENRVTIGGIHMPVSGEVL